jgi:DNA-binding transcriptional regulator GbsR (MarR family)
MDRPTAIFVDGLGSAAATSGVVSQLQGRIFALLYLQPGPMALDDLAAELGQSKSNISVNVRGLIDWHLVRLVRVGGSRRDHYEAATDFWRVFLEILERRYRFNVRQVLLAADEGARALADPSDGPAARERAELIKTRLVALTSFFSLLEAGIAAFTRGEPLAADALKVAGQPATKRRTS